MSAILRRARGEAGFTLVELLIAASLMMGILAASLGALTSIERGQRKGSDRSDVLAAGRPAIERITRELRQASAVTSFTQTATQTQLVVQGLVYDAAQAKAVSRSISYVCAAAARNCTRQVTGVDSSPRPVLSNLLNAATALSGSPSTSTSATYVSITAVLDLRGAATVTLSDGAQLRNKAAT